MTALNEDLRIKALARLAGSPSKAAYTALEKVFREARTTLTQSSDFDALASALKVFETISHRFSDDAMTAIADFLQDVEGRVLTHAERYGVLVRDEFFDKVYGTAALMVKAIEALSSLRYLQTPSVLAVLLPLSTHPLERIRKLALEHLAQTAVYNMAVFFGTKETPGIGAMPQQQVIAFVEKLEFAELNACWPGALVLVEKLLSEEMRGTKWSSSQVTISHVAIPASDQVAEVRQRAIAWLIRLYPKIDAVRQRSGLLSVLSHAIRTPRGAGQDWVAMGSRDALTVIEFFEALVATEAPQLVEKIEHDVYWIFFHSPSEEVRAAALRVRAAAEQCAEYQIFKVLIGFKGVFGEWTRERGSEVGWARKDQLRKERATSFIESINTETEPLWQERILRYCRIESDDLATFPVYIDFLERLAAQRGTFALSLIEDHADEVNGFLVPLLRGLAINGRREAVMRIIDGWLPQAKHLLQTAYALENSALFTSDLLARVLAASIEAKQVGAIVACMAAAVANSFVDDARETVELFTTGLAALTALQSPAWIFELWFRPNIKDFLGARDETLVDLVLENLLYLPEIDYHAEEILYIIAQTHPTQVLEFFIRRLQESSVRFASTFEAVPYELHKVNEALAQHPRECIAAVIPLLDGDYSDFVFGGARLLKNIFPTLPQAFESELGLLIKSGDSGDIERVLAVLRNYDGASAVAPLCLQIVEHLPLDDPLLGEVEVVLEATGVVMGELGFAEALEKKKRDAALWLHSESDKIRRFAERYSASLEQRIVWERARASERTALRKAQYGEYDEGE